MVEVFKTNVKTKRQAKTVVNHIHKVIRDCSANFDLEDCDKILRIAYSKEGFQPSHLIEMLSDMGINASILPNEQTVPGDEINLDHYLNL